jgi:hypothetical protein
MDEIGAGLFLMVFNLSKVLDRMGRKILEALTYTAGFINILQGNYKGKRNQRTAAAALLVLMWQMINTFPCPSHLFPFPIFSFLPPLPPAPPFSMLNYGRKGEPA